MVFCAKNSTSQTATFTQGSGGNVSVALLDQTSDIMQMVQDLVQSRN